MPFVPGQAVLRRYFRSGRNTFVKPMRVVGDDAAGLLLWMPRGSEFAVLHDADGRSLHDVALDRMREPRLVRKTWQGNDILVLMPPGAAYSVWWLFRDGAFQGWYVNLETPCVRRALSVDTTDLVLDVVVRPDRGWEWKDEDELAARTGRPGYFDRAGAERIRAEGERVIALAEAGVFPFDGTHVGFRPDPGWRPLRVNTTDPGWRPLGMNATDPG